MDATDLTHDAFLDGRVRLWQPRRGYRAGIDPVLLAAAVPAVSGQSGLELGCGVGAASLCLHARVPGLILTGVEIQPAYAELAQRNGAEAGAALTIVTASLTALPADLRQKQFDHVFMNPPYFDRAHGPASDDPGRDMAMAGDTPLADWLDIGIKRLAPKGFLTLIQHVTRLPEVLAAARGRLGSIVVRPIQPRADKPMNLFVFHGKLGGRSAFALAPPLLMHDGPHHLADTESYTKEVQDILRNGKGLRIER